MGSFNTVERHNERKNEHYFNSDVDLERANFNVHFKQNFRDDGTPETYQETFNRLLAEGKIVKHGTKSDAKIFCEMVYDINTTYFDERGGYEYAKKFFGEAYRQAVKEAGSEDYIISAVMHADERNSALSEKLGRDVYHYHLHVVYVPIVEKKLYFKKNNKNPELAGKLKEVIPQISQSNKWPLRMTAERDGKTVTLNSYAFLQDRYFEHMKSAGFEGFERGERGSTTEHLEVLEYKTKKQTERLDKITKQIEKKETKIDKLNEKIEVKTKASATVDEIDAMGKPAILGGIVTSADDMKKLKTLAKKGATADEKISAERKKRQAAVNECEKLKSELAKEKGKRPSTIEHLTWFSKFIAALKRAPKRLMSVVEDILRQPPEQAEPERERQRLKGAER